MNSLSNLSFCQDLAKQCMRSGQAFSISVSTNGVSFSTPGFNSTENIPRIWNSHSYNRRKSPSQRRRDQRRWEQFQSRKDPTAGNPPTAEQTFTTNPSSATNTSSESPKGVSSESDLNPPTFMEVDNPPPPLISPLSSPSHQPVYNQQNEEVSSSPEKKTNKTQPPEMILSFCAPDGASAIKQSKRISSQLKAVGVTSNNHFHFSLSERDKDDMSETLKNQTCKSAIS